MARGGKREGAGRKLSYDSYKAQYLANQSKMAANGLQMKQRMLSKTEFEAQYKRLANQRKIEIAKGSRKTLGNITRDLVEKQTYALTSKQVKAIKKEAKKRLGLTQMELREGSWMARVKNDYEQNLLQNTNWTEQEIEDEVKFYISTDIFGS